MATNKPPQRRIQGIRGSIPSGYLLGRISQGEGDVELIAPAQALGNGLFPSTKISLVMPAQFSVAGSPVTNNGTFTVTWANESPNLVLAGPASGGAAAPTFRSLVLADIPNLGANPTATAGDVVINGSATTYMRSDGAPAVQKAIGSQFGIVAVDGTTITSSAGLISAVAKDIVNAPDYAVGTWTPTDASGAGLVFSTAVGDYLKLGNLVVVNLFVMYPSTTNGLGAAIGGFPFNISATSPADVGVCPISCNNTTTAQGFLTRSGGVATLLLNSIGITAALSNSAFSGANVRSTIVYRSV